jgi:hypothetical protein
MIRSFVIAAALGLPVAALAQTAPAAPPPSPIVTVVPPAAAPVEHRLTPDEIAAAQADGAERNRAAELLAMRAGNADLALPAEKRKPQVHGEAGVAFGSNGYHEAFGSETTTLSDGTTVSVAGDYAQFGRSRVRPF